MKKILEQIWPSLIWTAIVFILLGMNTDGMKGSGLLKIKGIDKVIHFFLFLFFSLLWSLYLILAKKIIPVLVFLAVVLLGSLYGLGMEYYQLYFTNRNFSFWDAIADSIGAIAGAWVAIKKPLWK